LAAVDAALNTTLFEWRSTDPRARHQRKKLSRGYHAGDGLRGKKSLNFPDNTLIIAIYGGQAVEETVKLQLTPQQIADIKKQIGFELREIYLTKRSLNKLRVFRLRLNDEQQEILEQHLGQKVRELTVTRSVATRIL